MKIGSFWFVQILILDLKIYFQKWKIISSRRLAWLTYHGRNSADDWAHPRVQRRDSLERRVDQCIQQDIAERQALVDNVLIRKEGCIGTTRSPFARLLDKIKIDLEN